MKVIILALLALITLAYYANNVESHICASTGDPHYKTFSGLPKNLYGDEGDYLLAEDSKHHLKVMSRIRYGKHWKTRGINSAVAIKADGNIVEHFGSFYKVNGKKNAKLVLKNGAKVSVKRNKWIVTTKSGLSSEFVFVKINNGSSKKFPHYYFNIYVRVPKAYQGRMKGLCGTYKSKTVDKKIWTSFKKLKFAQKSRTNLFDRSFKPKKFNKFTKAAWKSAAFKKKAIAFCKKQKLTKRVFNNCLFDIKISGRFILSKGYKNEAGIKRKLRKISKAARAALRKKRVRVFAKCSSMEAAIKKRKEQLKKRKEQRKKMIMRCKKLLKKDGTPPTPAPLPPVGGTDGAPAQR